MGIKQATEAILGCMRSAVQREERVKIDVQGLVINVIIVCTECIFIYARLDYYKMFFKCKEFCKETVIIYFQCDLQITSDYTIKSGIKKRWTTPPSPPLPASLCPRQATFCPLGE